MPIYWEQFDWPSFATLITGFAAVGGATFVGWRQTKITERQAAIADKQNEILSQQTRLDQLARRNEMFDRRYEIFASVEDLLGEVIREGRAPEFPRLSVIWQAMGKAQFLFAPAVHAGLKQISDRLSEYRFSQVQIAIAHKRGRQPETKWIDAEAAQFEALVEDLKNLPDLFGEELRLSDV